MIINTVASIDLSCLGVNKKLTEKIKIVLEHPLMDPLAFEGFLLKKLDMAAPSVLL